MPSLCNVTDAVCKRAPYLSRCYVNGAPVDSAGNPAYMAMYKKAVAEGYHGFGPRACRACALLGGTLACEHLDEWFPGLAASECPRNYWRPPRPQCPVGGPPRSAPRFVAPRHFPRPGPGPARAARFPAPRRFRRSFRGYGALGSTGLGATGGAAWYQVWGPGNRWVGWLWADAASAFVLADTSHSVVRTASGQQVGHPSYCKTADAFVTGADGIKRRRPECR